MEITPLGDSALILRVSENFEPTKTTELVLRTLHQLESAQVPGVVELAPAYTTIAIFYDPIAVVEAGARPDGIQAMLEERIAGALTTSTKIKSGKPRKVEIPVCYDQEFGFDLERVAERAQVSIEQVVDLHSGADYQVSCIGFTPGFPFLSGLPEALATPRRATPRKEIPAGSVGIGGAQTGIYPMKSPGGWNVIGCTPLRLFDAGKTPPSFLSAGDRVRFRAITKEEFARSTM
jgi:inhibitor of KinA